MTEQEIITKLEELSPIIQEELQANIQKNQQESIFKGDSNHMKLMGTGWKALRLQRYGQWNIENMLLFPKTIKILQELPIPLAIRGVMFAKQESNSFVQAHSDGRNFILTAHLGLDIPIGCSITVSNITKHWDNNKILIFDTSFVHETANKSDKDRYILILDFWHPELSIEERRALELIYFIRNKYDAGEVKDIDCSYIRNGLPIEIEDYKNYRMVRDIPLLGKLFTKTI